MILGFTGTRNGPTPAQHETMKRFLSKMPMTLFIHGGARHSDTMAHYIVRQCHPDISIEIYPATVDQGSVVTSPVQHPRTTIHEAAPALERNRGIVDRIHGLLAVPRTDVDGDSGTWATVRYACEINRPVFIVKQNGEIVKFCKGAP